mmetsp:Transcript_3301/g.8436  ORF Transcript_3301/g.8436 Transcript_3301/m.8436 type:complete len:333 (-) Transcript_3301:52-1050(-)
MVQEFLEGELPRRNGQNGIHEELVYRGGGSGPAGLASVAVSAPPLAVRHLLQTTAARVERRSASKPLAAEQRLVGVSHATRSAPVLPSILFLAGTVPNLHSRQNVVKFEEVATQGEGVVGRLDSGIPLPQSLTRVLGQVVDEHSRPDKLNVVEQHGQPLLFGGLRGSEHLHHKGDLGSLSLFDVGVRHVLQLDILVREFHVALVPGLDQLHLLFLELCVRETPLQVVDLVLFLVSKVLDADGVAGVGRLVSTFETKPQPIRDRVLPETGTAWVVRRCAWVVFAHDQVLFGFASLTFAAEPVPSIGRSQFLRGLDDLHRVPIPRVLDPHELSG